MWPSDQASQRASVEQSDGSRAPNLGILPCGLGARNTLRLEGEMALYEHEISDQINVWEGRIGPLL